MTNPETRDDSQTDFTLDLSDGDPQGSLELGGVTLLFSDPVGPEIVVGDIVVNLDSGEIKKETRPTSKLRHAEDFEYGRHGGDDGEKPFIGSE